VAGCKFKSGIKQAMTDRKMCGSANLGWIWNDGIICWVVDALVANERAKERRRRDSIYSGA
jgi:hypothetical protein